MKSSIPAVQSNGAWTSQLSSVCTERLPQVGFTEEALAWPAREPEDTAQEHQVLWRKP